MDRHRLLGDIYREKFGPLNIVMLFRPDDVETVFRNEGPYPSRGEIDSLKAYRNSRKKWYSTTGLLLLYVFFTYPSEVISLELLMHVFVNVC